MQKYMKEILKSVSDPLTNADGTRITETGEWEKKKETIRQLLQEHVYGSMPEMPDVISVERETPEISVYGGRATEKFYMLTADKMYPEFHFGLRILRPAADHPLPVLFMVLCDSSEDGYTYQYAEDILSRGYAIAMVDRIPAAPEIPDSDIQLWEKPELNCDPYCYYSVYRTRNLSYPENDLPLNEYMEQYPHIFRYGKIALGAHCVRVALSFVLGLGFADPERIAVTGHSRDGKVSLCAAVYDDRIKAVIPHGSGCGGTALYKAPAKGMERIDDMVRMWPSWLPCLAKYRNGHEDDMPLDMHFARACIAPRGIMNTEGLQDFWAGGFSSYIGKHAAQDVFDLYGVSDRNGMFIRQGFHEMSREDIRQTLDFCNMIFDGTKPGYDFAGAEYPL